MSNRPGLILPIGLAPVLFLIGCGDALDQAKFDRRKVGMSVQEVEAILGKGGKEISSADLTSLMCEALIPRAETDAKGSAKLPKLELPDCDRVNRIFKKGF
jgi:hypothetical protein